MNRLVLAFGIVCLLQGLSAEPRPEFGLSISVAASAKITSVKSDVVSINAEVKALAPLPNLDSGLARLLTTKQKIEEVISNFDGKTSAILAAYDSLLAATDGNIDNAFTPFINEINAATSYIGGDGAAIAATLSGITYTGISTELIDAFGRISVGLVDLKIKTLSVAAAINAAVTSAGSASAVTASSLRQFLTLKKMYDMLKSATTLRTYLPLVTYILKTAKENVIEADSFVLNLKSMLNTDVSSVSTSFASDLDAKTAEIKADIAAKFAIDANGAAGVETGYLALTGLNSATQYNELSTQIGVLKNLFTVSALSAQTTTLSTAFATITSGLQALITSLQTGTSVNDNTLVNSLVDTLVGNDKYGRYCYNKYKYIVEGLFDLSFDAGWQCVDKELIRLEQLRVTLLLIIDLLAVDFEDVLNQVGVCNQLTSATNLNTCVTQLSMYYTNLFLATKDKIAAVYTLAGDEAIAVENRLLICFQLINLDSSITQVAAVNANLAICSADGPTGSD
ncbi:uncharacterized protein LOC126562114 [Anopheles maculipalpis]|uniref:uncharacterized protein LOC126562114 n=1 Tax=Anopheles maculipalpis TaxID=1496333 RepID=UPI0021595290|nr:uncharacterized protein LOC126562114 [Anopheles maculipalpis]